MIALTQKNKSITNIHWRKLLIDDRSWKEEACTIDEASVIDAFSLFVHYLSGISQKEC
jgi:hypothetical protein